MADALTHRMPTVRDGYRSLAEHVRDHGDMVAPRGQAVRELRGVTVLIDDVTRDTMPVGMGRNLNTAIGAIEALNLVGGVSTPRLLERAAPVFRRFMDGETLAGAYGPRVRWQLHSVVERLVDDGDSRQAIVQIWDPAYDGFGTTRDMPCTLSFQFFLRGGFLECHSMMRSNDVWLGFAYDIAMFSALHLTLANVLGATPGRLVHRVGSLHLYERDFAALDGLTEPDDSTIPPLGLDVSAVEIAQRRAQRILDGSHWPESETEEWYEQQLAPYRDGEDE